MAVGGDCCIGTNFTLSGTSVQCVHGIKPGMCSFIHATGDGTGAFFTGITVPLGDLILYLGIVGGIVAIFMAIASKVRTAVS